MAHTIIYPNNRVNIIIWTFVQPRKALPNKNIFHSSYRASAFRKNKKVKQLNALFKFKCKQDNFIKITSNFQSKIDKHKFLNPFNLMMIF